MAWSTPGTVSAGEVYTAARYNTDTVGNLMMGNPVFTDEAARDAAITSPSEGQRVYLTAPTVPAATGATTYIPTGVQTIYNGSVWVCVTPVSAFTGAAGNRAGTYSATLTGSPGVNPSVTLVTGTTVMLSFAAYMGPTALEYSRVSVAVSGASTIAANDDWGIILRPDTSTIDVQTRFGLTQVISGLTAGTNTFTLQYKTDGGTTLFGGRTITAQGIA